MTNVWSSYLLNGEPSSIWTEVVLNARCMYSSSSSFSFSSSSSSSSSSCSSLYCYSAATLDGITPHGVKAVRNIVNDSVIDVFYYMSPCFGPEVVTLCFVSQLLLLLLLLFLSSYRFLMGFAGRFTSCITSSWYVILSF